MTIGGCWALEGLLTIEDPPAEEPCILGRRVGLADVEVCLWREVVGDIGIG